MKPIVTVIEPEGPDDWFSRLSDFAQVRFYDPEGPVVAAKVSEILSCSDGVIITSATAIDGAQMDLAPRLKIVAKCGGPPSNVDIAHATLRGIAVSCVPGANTTSIAEYTVMLIIAALRRFDLHAGVIKNGGWRAQGFLLGHDLKDAVIGIVGLGAIGYEVALRLRPFGCRCLVYSPHARANRASEDWLEFRDSLDDLLPLCDAVTLHAKVTEENTELFDARLFALMKRGAVFVNTARGALVNERDLAAALESGHLAAAAVDVFQVEPPEKDLPLMNCRNVILTPHSSGWTEEALRRECSGAVASVIAFFKGEEIPGLLNVDFRRANRF